MREVVITGLGVICPIGNSVREAWQNALDGVSGVGPITRFDATDFGCQIAAEVKNFDPVTYINPKEARRYDRFIHFGTAAGIQAFEDAGLDKVSFDPERFGVAVGSGIGGLEVMTENAQSLLQKGPRRISPFMIPGIIGNMVDGLLSIRYGLKGPSLSHVSACATGLHAIGEAGRIIACGEADIMMAGGADALVTPLAVAGFDNMHALSRRNDDPKTASRPFEKNRDGFVIGEGAGVLILEEKEHALARGAKIYATLAGYGMSSDAYHITTPSQEGPERSMRLALKSAGIRPDAIQYLNAHGTSTSVGDANESAAIEAVFGDAAQNLVVSSTKSMTGHLLGGAGGLESVFTVLAIHEGIVPPTINLFEKDEACRLDYCADGARKLAISYAMKNSFGFGGTNATLIFRRAE
ncbi:MAG TPA: beta-ketoacyl-[acyl-carrier-protein] synthase II [Sutterella sp.]|nr:beta-ketoacyl-[acyl-carrier-protein] synthase II [Sutterella sp.]